MSIRINLGQLFGDSKKQTKQTDILQDSQSLSSATFSSHSNTQYHLNSELFAKQSCSNYCISIQSSGQSQKDRVPGERLYYEHKNYEARRTLHLQQLKHENLIKQKQIVTGVPQINQKSKKIAQKIKQNPEKLNQKAQKQIKIMTPTAIKKQQQQLKNCTFKPQLVSKPREKQLGRKKQQVFDQLFNQHRVKQLKKKMATQESEQDMSKKISKAQFQAFIQRSDKFLQKVNKKQQILSSTFRTHDTKSGARLFQPTINKEVQYLFPSNKPKKTYFKKQKLISSKDQTKPYYSIFNKHKNDEIEISDENSFEQKNNLNYYEKYQDESSLRKQFNQFGIQQDVNESDENRDIQGSHDSNEDQPEIQQIRINNFSDKYQ